MSDFSMSQRSIMWCFQTVGLKNVLLTENLCFNICDENIGKGNCCHFAHRGPLKWNEFSLRINLSIPRR